MGQREENITLKDSQAEINCEMNNYFGQALRELRISRNMKQYKAAELLGITAAQWSVYESGKSRPNLDTIIKICEFMDVSPLALLAKTLNKSKFAGTGLDLSFDEYENITAITSSAIENHMRVKVKKLSDLISS